MTRYHSDIEDQETIEEEPPSPEDFKREWDEYWRDCNQTLWEQRWNVSEDE